MIPVVLFIFCVTQQLWKSYNNDYGRDNQIKHKHPKVQLLILWLLMRWPHYRTVNDF